MENDIISNRPDYVDEDKIDQDLICAICSCPFEDPVVHSCGNTFCRICINLVVNSQCPLCRGALTEKNFSIVNTAFKRMLGALEVRCPLCRKTLKRDTLESHVASCPIGNRVD